MSEPTTWEVRYNTDRSYSLYTTVTASSEEEAKAEAKKKIASISKKGYLVSVKPVRSAASLKRNKDQAYFPVTDKTLADLNRANRVMHDARTHLTKAEVERELEDLRKKQAMAKTQSRAYEISYYENMLKRIQEGKPAEE